MAFGLLLLILLGVAAAPSTTRAAPPAQEPDSDLPSVSGGSGLWAENCQPCHGPTGAGDGPSAQGIPEPLPDLSDPQLARQLVPTENFDVIKNGRIEKMMPPWGNRLSDEQMWDLTAYVWKLGTSSQDLAAGQTLYTEQCAACHGPAGAGDGPQAPAEIVDFTDWQVMARQSQAGLQESFQAVEAHRQLETLSEEQVGQALDFVRTFSFAVPAQNGVLTGQVLNGTTNEPQAGVELTLYGFQGEAQVERVTTQADGEGRFKFENLPTEHSITYILEGSYESVTYVSQQPAAFTPDSAETSLDLNVYETTDDPSVISITQLHYLISFNPGAVSIAQVFVVGNSSDRSYVGQDGQTFTFNLPPQAVDVSFQNDPLGDRFVQTGDGYADTEPVVPGPQGASVVAVYGVPFNSDSVDIEVPLPANVVSANVLMQDLGAELSSDQLQFSDTRTIQGSSFAIYNGGSLPAGETVTLRLSGLDDLDFSATGMGTVPEAAGAAPPHLVDLDQGLLRWIVVGLGAVFIVVAAAVYPSLRPRLTHQAGQHAADPDTRRQQLLLLLARLDETYEAGQLDEEVYRQARARYKAELVDLLE